MNSSTHLATPTTNARKHSFAPVVASNTRVLVLGSLPGDVSIRQQQYYAHPQNKFWELIGVVIDVDLRRLAYAERVAALLKHGIGVWDVVAQADRRGSLDAAITNATHNSFIDVARTLPCLRAIAFNGGTASRLGRRQLAVHKHSWHLIDLPSSSPAHTLAYAQKLQRWKVLRDVLI